MKTILSICLAALLLPACLHAGPLARIYIAPQDVGIRATAAQQFSAIGEDADGNEVSTGTVVWSANAAAGSITYAGLFTAGATAGKYDNAVTASVAGGFTATANVEVYSAEQRNGYGLERSIGSLAAGAFDSPMDIAFDGSGNAYVLSQLGNAINKIDSTGHYLAQYKLDFTLGDTAFLGVSSSGTMYVADPVSYLVRKYNSSGAFVTQFGSSGTGNGQFTELTDMAVDSTGQVYVADAAACRMQVFDSSGGFVRSWITQISGYNCPPLAIAVDRTDHLWVVIKDDYNGYYAMLRQYDSAGSQVYNGRIYIRVLTHYVGNAFIPYPFSIAVDDSGDVYQASGNTITGFSKLPNLTYDSFVVWGCFGREIGSFDGAAGIAMDSSGKVCVADKGNNRIQAFSSTGQPLGAWYSSGNAKGQLKYPSGIAVDSAGHIYVSDTGNRRIQEFDADGGFVRELASLRQCDSAFACSSGLTLDTSDNLYIADVTGNRILCFNSGGALISNWSLPASPDSTIPAPLGIARNAAGGIYAVDSSRNLVNTLDSGGSFLTSWLSAGTGNGQVQTPAGIAVESHGYAFVSDYGNNRVQKFNNGAYMTKWGATGTGNGQFHGPAGICVDSADYVYVADSGNGRVQKFNSSGVYSTQLGSYGFGKFQFSDPEAVAVDALGNLYVADTGNHRVLKFIKVASLSVTITSPTSGTTYVTHDPTLDLGGTAVSAASVTWSNSRGGSGTCIGTGNWTAPAIPLKPGTNTLTVTARDGYGGSATDILYITCYAPSITITSPTTQASYITTSSTVGVSGTASDDVAVSSVTWTNDRGGSGTCSGTTGWSASGIALQSGKNVLTFTAHDSGGNTNSATLLVFRELSAPTTIAQARALPDDAEVYLTDQLVTAVFADCLYIEDSTRVSAIKVVPLCPIGSISAGSVVDVAGTLNTGSDGERCIEGTALL
jgi:tripartite motif-containing protein 71